MTEQSDLFTARSRNEHLLQLSRQVVAALDGRGWVTSSQLPALLVAGVWLATTQDARAYIDPGSSSYFFQLLIAGLTALVFFFSSLRRKVVGLFKGSTHHDAPLPKEPVGADQQPKPEA